MNNLSSINIQMLCMFLAALENVDAFPHVNMTDIYKIILKEMILKNQY